MIVVYELAILIMYFWHKNFCRYSFSVDSGGGVDAMIAVSFNALLEIAELFYVVDNFYIVVYFVVVGTGVGSYKWQQSGDMNMWVYLNQWTAIKVHVVTQQHRI